MDSRLLPRQPDLQPINQVPVTQKHQAVTNLSVRPVPGLSLAVWLFEGLAVCVLRLLVL
ncbi:hypothetical protein HY375_00250 [Candidatus Berkelbacteria bacterium]|nr:hypothetical protein [Candidatus Berkelbacteria bacterium]